MIKINLLPQDMPGKGPAAARSGGGGGGAVVALVLLFAFAVVGVAGYYVYSYQSETARKTAALDTERRELERRRGELQREHANLRESLNTLRNQAAVIEVLDAKDRLFWAKKLNILPKFVPDGIFLTSITMEEVVKEVETPESRKAFNDWKKQNNRNIPQPPRVMVPVITASMRLNGVAYVADGTSDQRLQLILDFWNSLAEDKVVVPYTGDQAGFLEHMVPLINSEEFTTDRVEGREVTKFSFQMNTIPIQASPRSAEGST